MATGGWAYFHLDITASMLVNGSHTLAVDLVRTSTKGDPDLYMSHGTFPTLVVHEYVPREPPRLSLTIQCVCYVQVRDNSMRSVRGEQCPARHFGSSREIHFRSGTHPNERLSDAGDHLLDWL